MSDSYLASVFDSAFFETQHKQQIQILQKIKVIKTIIQIAISSVPISNRWSFYAKSNSSNYSEPALSYTRFVSRWFKTIFDGSSAIKYIGS